MKESVEEDAGYFQSQPIKKIKGQTLPVEIKKYNPNGVEMLIDGKKEQRIIETVHGLVIMMI